MVRERLKTYFWKFMLSSSYGFAWRGARGSCVQDTPYYI